MPSKRSWKALSPTAPARPRPSTAARRSPARRHEPELRDKWFVGITPQYSVACWEGAAKSADELFLMTSDMFADSQPAHLLRYRSLPHGSASDPTWRTLSSDEQDTLGATSCLGYAAARIRVLSSSDSDSSLVVFEFQEFQRSFPQLLLRARATAPRLSSSSTMNRPRLRSRSPSSGKNGSVRLPALPAQARKALTAGRVVLGSESAKLRGSEEPPSNLYAR